MGSTGVYAGLRIPQLETLGRMFHSLRNQRASQSALMWSALGQILCEANTQYSGFVQGGDSPEPFPWDGCTAHGITDAIHDIPLLEAPR